MAEQFILTKYLVRVHSHTMMTSFHLVSMQTVNMEFPINQTEDRIGNFCACKYSYCTWLRSVIDCDNKMLTRLQQEQLFAMKRQRKVKEIKITS